MTVADEFIDAINSHTGELNDDGEARVRSIIDHVIGRTGPRELQLRLSGEQQPAVWVAIVTYTGDDRDVSEAAAGTDPVVALIRLAEQLIDSGMCTACGHVTSFLPADDESTLHRLMEAGACVIHWTGSRYTRTCERARSG